MLMARLVSSPTSLSKLVTEQAQVQVESLSTEVRIFFV